MRRNLCRAIHSHDECFGTQGIQRPLELDPDDECFVGRLAGIDDVIGFHGSTIVELKAAFHEAVDDYIETCRIVGMASGDPS